MTLVDIVGPSSPTRRYHALDGLRGVAALLVLCGHVMLTSPVYADAILGVGRPEPGTVAWWLTYSPLHLLWAGTEAVFVFFILSGFVLTGPVLKGGFSWLPYYRQRLPRLYLPVWGSLLFAAALVALVPRSVASGASWWTNGHQQVTLWSGLTDALLLGPISVLNSPLWSLQWEVWFSLLLPGYVFLAYTTRKSRIRTLSYILISFAAMSLYALTAVDAFRYLPIFALGVLMYVHLNSIARIARIVDRQKGWWWGLSVIALLMTSSFWILQANPNIPDSVVSASRLLQVGGAALVVIIALSWEKATYRLRGNVLQWLGSRSFSLYLIHDPIVSTTALVLGAPETPFVTLVIALPLSVGFAEIFFRLVERPSHRLAKRMSGRETSAAKATEKVS